MAAQVIPEELLVPFSDFLDANPNLAPLVNNYFYVQTTAGAMGTYNRTLTLYQLLSMRRGNYAAYTSDYGPGAIIVLGGCTSFYARIAQFLGSAVFLNSQVLSVKRPPAEAGAKATVKIRVQLPGAAGKMIGHKYIVRA